MKKMQVKLSVASIRSAIRLLEERRDRLAEQQKEFINRLAEIGVLIAEIEFTNAYYDDRPHRWNLKVEDTKTGCKIVASGQDVMFIEFGSGVYHNTDGYPGERPAGIVGIGEYGKGYGKRNAWAYVDEQSGEKFITRGIPAAAPMWKASTEIKQAIQKVAREVFV